MSISLLYELFNIQLNKVYKCKKQANRYKKFKILLNSFFDIINRSRNIIT